MKTLTQCVLLALVTSIWLGTSAQQRKQDPCEKANQTGITVDLVECSQKTLAQADADLNKTYRQLIAKMGNKQWETKLRRAQQAWIKYRDANCDYESEFSGGGSATTFEYNFCLAEMTKTRAKELLDMLNQIKDRG
jgi:uncharacterized protein YecT (DUF1311 family)